MSVKGDALTIIQGITNFNAWWLGVPPLIQRRLLWRVVRVRSPQRPTGLKELGSALETSELQLNAFAKYHDESLSPRLKLAAFTQLLPNDIQDIVLQSTGTASTHEEVRDKVKGLVCKRMAVNSGPAPVQEEEYWRKATGWMLGAAGKCTMCYACGDRGHLARDGLSFPSTPQDWQEQRKRRK